MFLHSIQAVTVAIINLVIYMGEPKYSLQIITISSVNVKHRISNIWIHTDVEIKSNDAFQSTENTQWTWYN